MGRSCHVLRVFTREGDGGNHLGVVTDQSGLDDVALQEIATELGFSETIYLEWSDPATPRVRIFTPSAELPFAGHPLVGMTWVLNVLGPGSVATIECAVGPVRAWMDGDVAWIETSLDQRVEVLDEAAGYDPGPPAVAVYEVAMPLPYHVIELADSEAVRSVRVPEAGMVSVYAWLDPSTIHTRFFAPGHGIVEDPATGSAAVAIAASLQATGRTSGSVTLLQGEEIGFPSRIDMNWSDGSVSIGGRVAHDEVRWLDR